MVNYSFICQSQDMSIQSLICFRRDEVFTCFYIGEYGVLWVGAFLAFEAAFA